MRLRRLVGRVLDRALATPRELDRSAPADLEALRHRVQETRAALEVLERQMRGLRVQLQTLRREDRPPAHRYLDDGVEPELDRLRPSLLEPARARRRGYRTPVDAGEGFDPVDEFDSKLDVRRFAEQHGLRVPTLLGLWPTPDDVPWDELPGEFVLKGTRGAGAISVFPLVSHGDGFVDLIGQRPTTRHEVTAALWARHKPGERFFAEELLGSTTPSGSRLPFDIKVFCSHDGPLWIEVRRGTWTRYRGGTLELKVFAPDGSPLPTARPFFAQDPDIASPRHLSEVVEQSRRLARAIRSPFVRLDFYETDAGLFFGEVTPYPGRTPAHGDDLDRAFGSALEAGHASLLSTLAAEGTLALRRGDA